MKRFRAAFVVSSGYNEIEREKILLTPGKWKQREIDVSLSLCYCRSFGILQEWLRLNAYMALSENRSALWKKYKKKFKLESSIQIFTLKDLHKARGWQAIFREFHFLDIVSRVDKIDKKSLGVQIFFKKFSFTIPSLQEFPSVTLRGLILTGIQSMSTSA